MAIQAGFLLQFALDDIPRLHDHALPDSGQLYVFDLGPSPPFESSFGVCHRAAAKSELRRTERPTGLPCAAEPGCFERGVAFGITAVPGIDVELLKAHAREARGFPYG